MALADARKRNHLCVALASLDFAVASECVEKSERSIERRDVLLFRF